MEGTFHDAALLLVIRTQCRQSGGNHASFPHLVDDPLIERAGAEIRGLFGHFELRRDGRRSSNPGDTKARRDRFRKAAQVHHATISIVGFDRPRVRR